jgi:hypothetical protein
MMMFCQFQHYDKVSTQFPSIPGDAMEKALRCASFCGGVLFSSKVLEIIANRVEISNLSGMKMNHLQQRVTMK